jgi:acyl-CoA synthetase (AMP-forming)/AMP-acid ligase II
MNLLEMYRANAADRGSEAAITFTRAPHAGITLSWSELLGRADSLAGQLQRATVSRGSRVAVSLHEHPDTLPTLLALWQLHATPVLLDPQWGESIRATVISHSRADVLLTVGEAPTIEPVASQSWEGRPALPANTALIAYTSGSTGSPKGIPVRHERLVAALFSAAGALSAFRGASPARVASSMRLSGFGVLALHYLWAAAFAAEVVVLAPLELTSAGAYWSELEEHAIDQAVLVAPLFELLLRASAPRSGRARTLFINSSGPISAETHARFMERFGAVALNCYGLTETSFACTIGDVDERGTSSQAVGRPDLLLARLRGADGGVVEGAGEGELELRGPTLSDGYYDNEQANAALFDGPWLRSGDLARRDQSGKYWIVGRLKDAVMKGGSTVYLTEVEEACAALDGVHEAVAVRMQLSGGIEDLAVIVRPEAGVAADARELKAALEQALGAERSPRRILLTDGAIPRLGQSKIDRRASQLLFSVLCELFEVDARKLPANG